MPAKSGNPDRRGFQTMMNSALAFAASSMVVPFFVHWLWALALFLFSAVAFIVMESISCPPPNQPRAFQYFYRNNLSNSRRPVLVCLGDSLTHGTTSYNYTIHIPTQLTSALAMEPPKAKSIFADPLWVVNCGQNYITTHTIWRERLNKALDCHPDYILLLIGTNDMLSVARPGTFGNYITRINDLPETPSLPTFARNFNGILSHIQQASPMTQVGVCTLPPIGEDMRSSANKVVRQANEIIEQACQQYGDRCTLIPVFDRLESILEKEGKRGGQVTVFALQAAFMNAVYHILPGWVSWNALGSLVGHKILHDGIHLNERGGEEMVSLIVEWLVNKGVAKAIAVKS